MPDSVAERVASRWPAHLAALAFACMLVVIAASAYIRLSGTFPALAEATSWARGAHRIAASLAGMAVLGLAWLAYQGRVPRAAAYVALAVTVFLAVLGAAFGTTPSAMAALGNVVGGLALATLLAWVHAKVSARSGSASRRLTVAALGLACLQAGLGAWIGTRSAPVETGVLVGHVLLGAMVAMLSGWLGVRLAATHRVSTGLALIALGAAAPLAGAVSAFFDPPAEISLIHPVMAAMLLALLARVYARLPSGERA